MGDDDKLRPLRHFGDLAGKSADIRVVKWSIDLVQKTERRRTVFEDGEDERNGGHRLFAAGEKQDILQAFAGRLSHDLDTGFENVVGIEQGHLAASAAKKVLEKLNKMSVDRVERGLEFITRPLLDLAKGFLGRSDAVDDVLTLRGQE